MSASILLTIAVTMSEAYLYFSRENYRCSSYINYVLDIDVVPIYMLDIDVSSSY